MIRNAVSVFGGIEVGRYSCKKAGLDIMNYYSSEVNGHAIKVANKNHPDIIQVGDINNWRNWDIDWSSVDLLLGGSPCQGFSFAGKQLNFDDPRSKLFFVYADILNHIREVNPNVKFLLENVKMKQEYKEVITNCVKAEPIEINSALVSAQNRRRLYWTNIEGVQQPRDRGIMLKDIVHEYMDEVVPYEVDNFNIHPSGGGMNGEVYSVFRNKSRTITTNKGEGQKVSVCTGIYTDIPESALEKIPEIVEKYGYLPKMFNPYNMSEIKDKAPTQTTGRLWTGSRAICFHEILAEYVVPFDETLQILDKEVQKGKVGYFRKDSQANRVYYIHDKAVTLCGDAGGGAAKMGQYLFGCITPDRIEKRQNGQRFSEGKKFYTLTAQDKHGILVEGYIRKLTPIECERLQTLPDNYTEGISNAQRYKALGNGWTADVITEILENYYGHQGYLMDI